MKPEHISESTVARIAGNIAAGMIGRQYQYIADRPSDEALGIRAVSMARAIVAEVQRTRAPEEAPK